MEPATLLVTLRWVAAVGNLLFLAGLAMPAMMGSSSGRFPAILGTALVAFHPAVLEFLAELRIDGWGVRAGGLEHRMVFAFSSNVATPGAWRWNRDRSPAFLPKARAAAANDTRLRTG